MSGERVGKTTHTNGARWRCTVVPVYRAPDRQTDQHRERTAHFLLVGGGSSVPATVHRICPEARISVLCARDTAKSFAGSDAVAQVYVPERPTELDGWIQAARALDLADPVTAVGSALDPTMRHASVIGAALGLPTEAPETVRAAEDKIEMRRRLRSAGVDPTPADAVHDERSILDFAAHHGYPLICKPIAGTGSRGVSRIDGPDDGPSALEWASRAGSTDLGGLLVEPLIAGSEYSVECVSQHGQHIVVCITEKHSEPRHFVELGHVVPARLDPRLRARIAATVRAALTALGVSRSVTHTEIVVAGDTVRIVETHLRPAGDEIPVLVTHALGVDLYEVTVRLWLGESVLDRVRSAASLAARAESAAAVWFLAPPRTGRVVAIRGEERARRLPGTIGVEVSTAVGETYHGIRDSDSRAGHVCTAGRSPDQALRRAQAAAATITIELA